MELHTYTTSDEVIRGMADFFIATVNASINTKGSCSVVLSGGNSPKKLYELLASAAYRDQADWSKIYFFFGDERYVPFTDDNNNGRMAKETLFDPLQIEESKIFYINTALPAQEAATDYAKKIERYFDKKPIQFDLVLLGLGDNAHTASLFPHTKVLYEMKALTSALFIDENNAWRITMTAPLINEAHAIAFLVYGETKASAVHYIIEGKRDIDNYPAQLIDPSEGTLDWFLDKAAAAMLN